MYVFSENEGRLIRELAGQHREAAAHLARLELALRVAISTLCAAHGLDGEWRVADDLSGMIPVDPKMHEGEAHARVQFQVVEGGGGNQHGG